MILNQNPFDGLVKVIIVLVVLGMVMGLLLTGMDWWPGKAETPSAQPGPDVIREQSGQSQADPEETLALEATKARYAADNAYRRERQMQDLQMRPAVVLILVAALGMAILLVAGALAAVVLRGSRRQPVRIPVNDPWKSPAYKAAQIELARRRENLNRLARPVRVMVPAKAGYRKLRIPNGNERNRLN